MYKDKVNVKLKPSEILLEKKNQLKWMCKTNMLIYLILSKNWTNKFKKNCDMTNDVVQYECINIKLCFNF